MPPSRTPQQELARIGLSPERVGDALAVALEQSPPWLTRATLVDAERKQQESSRLSTSADEQRRALVTAKQAAVAALRRKDADLTEEDARDAVSRALMASEPSGGLLGQRTELGSLLRDGVPPAPWLPSPSLGDRLFYAESVWIISGHKKSGKSWAMLATALDVIRAGRPVVYLDFENGRRRFARRLVAIGAQPHEVDERLHYIAAPKGLTLDGMPAMLEEVARELPGAFVVIDSLRGYMARLSPSARPLDPNAAQDVEAVCAPLNDARDAGLTVGIIDHAKKSGSDSDEYSTSGSQAKEAAVDAVYFWTKVEPFSVEQQGAVKIAATSDRDGELDFVRYWHVGGQGQQRPFCFKAGPEGDFGAAGRIVLDVRQAVMDADKPMTKSAVRQAVKGDNGKIDAALATLVSDPSEPIWAEQSGSRVSYVWDDEREVQAGLEV